MIERSTTELSMEKYLDEDEFIEALINQDEKAFRELVRLHYKMLRMLAAAITGDSIADEVVQQAWISVMRALPKFEKRSSLKTWLSRIVVNEAKTRLRREKRYSSLEAMGFDEPDPFFDQFDQRGNWGNGPVSWHGDTPESLLEKSELNACIQKTLSALPALQRTTFVMRELQGHSYETICNTLEVTESNIRVLLHRARTKLLKTVEHFQEVGQCL